MSEVKVITKGELLYILEALQLCSDELEAVYEADDCDYITTSGAEEALREATTIVESILLNKEKDIDIEGLVDD